MALPADYITGTITLTNGSTAFTGTDTGWLAADFREGDTIPYVAGGESFAPPIISTITSNTAGTLTTPWAGPTLTDVAYRMRYQWDSSRVSAQTRTMIEQLGNGNLQSISALTGPGVLVFDGPHSTVVRPETDFINGVAYDVQVDTLADRAAYDGQTEGFAVLVSDVGDGRSAIYSKNSNTVGDWSDPAYVTGPVGPLPTLDVGTTTTLPPGSDATVGIVPVTGGYELDFGVPEGEGFNWAGLYNIANAYVQDDVVRHNGSAFIALQAVPAGTSPSSVFPPVDTAFWAVLAAKGQDGTGTGDVVGPSSSTDGLIAGFNGTTGKLLKQLTLTQVLDLVGGAAQGDILYRGATQWQRLAKGAAGQVLRQNAALTAPEWKPDWEDIYTGPISGATVSFNNLAPFRFLRISCAPIASVAGSTIMLRFSGNNGASYDASPIYTQMYLYNTSVSSTPTGALGSNTTAFQMQLSALELGSTRGIFELEFNDFNTTTSRLLMLGRTLNHGGSGTVYSGKLDGAYAQAGSNALQFSISSGTMSGFISIQGMRG